MQQRFTRLDWCLVPGSPIVYHKTLWLVSRNREWRARRDARAPHVPPRLTPDAGLAIVHTAAFIPTRSCEKPIMSLSFPFPHVDTKLHVPTIQLGLVARPCLSRQLDRCVQHRLLLVCAPAGSARPRSSASGAGRARGRSPGSRWTPPTTTQRISRRTVPQGSAR